MLPRMIPTITGHLLQAILVSQVQGIHDGPKYPYQYVFDMQLSHEDSVSCMPVGPDPLSDIFVLCPPRWNEVRLRSRLRICSFCIQLGPAPYLLLLLPSIPMPSSHQKSG